MTEQIPIVICDQCQTILEYKELWGKKHIEETGHKRYSQKWLEKEMLERMINSPYKEKS